MLRSCPQCTRPAADHVRYCEQCGSPLSDNTTRYLCAAVHRDSAYCEEAIGEFLVEPVRALPPSTGADSAAVLRDAVAAHTRRRVRDGLLLVLLLVFALVAPALFAMWLVVALLGWFGTGAHKKRSSVSGRAVVVAVLGAVAAYYLLFALLEGVGINPAYLPYYLAQAFGGTTGSALTTSAVLIGSMILAVVLGDTFLVHWLVHTCFRRDRFVTDPRHRQPGADTLEVGLRTLGVAGYGRELARLAAADRTGQVAGRADVVVHRDFVPFVGAGVLVETDAVPFPLVKDENAEHTAPVDVVELHDHISAALDALRTSSALGPSGRLRDLTMREQVFVASDQLVVHGGEFPRAAVLPSLDHPPVGSVDLGLARTLAQEPVEWARYYRCYQVEAWDRDLTASCFVHVGTDQKLLYLERAHCILPPLAPRFRRIDEPSNPVDPIGDAMVALILLPASIAQRLRRVFGAFQRLRQRPGEIVPDRYGAARSLRELASTDEYRTYFQSADAQRYQGIMNSVLVRAVGNYLEDRGYSVVEFQQAVAPVFQSFAHATINNSSIGPNARTHNAARVPGTSQEKR